MAIEQADSNQSLGDFLAPECVSVNVACSDSADAIRHAALLLRDAGAVDDGYVDAALQREDQFPTGLPTEPAGVALPHIDTGVLHPALALLTLRTPVYFTEMGTTDSRILVSVVIMLAIPAGDAHVRVLGALADLIQHPDFLIDVLDADSSYAAYDVYQAWVKQIEKQ